LNYFADRLHRLPRIPNIRTSENSVMAKFNFGELPFHAVR
jgi:hypothetical protein